MAVLCRFLNVWDSLARLCIPARYRFDEDSGSDENTERGRLLLRQEQASTRLLTVPTCCPWYAAATSHCERICTIRASAKTGLCCPSSPPAPHHGQT